MGILKVRPCQDTDATRRAALQIAFMLPERIDEARAILDRAAYLLENFLIVPPASLAGVIASRTRIKPEIKPDAVLQPVSAGVPSPD